MAKSPTAAPKDDTSSPKIEMVSVVLNCVYSGFEGEPGPGATISVPTDESDRLISIGAAKKAE